MRAQYIRCNVVKQELSIYTVPSSALEIESIKMILKKMSMNSFEESGNSRGILKTILTFLC